MAKPDTIFHYAPASLQTIINLKRSNIYFNKPVNFNDPHDCLAEFYFHISDIDIEKYKKNKISKREGISNKLLIELDFMSNDTFKNLLFKEAESNINDLKKKSRDEFGIACFAEKNNNQLMWAHYADGFKGICIEFNTKYEPFTKLRKVKYTDSEIKFNVGKLVLRKGFNNIESSEVAKTWATKSKVWSYEKEWRTVHKIGGTLYTYNQEAIKAIYFGELIDKTVKEIIFLVIGGQNDTVKFYDSSFNILTKKMEFKEVNYIPYLIAKNAGLL